jgi:3-hydroxyisobutyrate dehydrogenase-like beta-hydroxyacid dehydrogenase
MHGIIGVGLLGSAIAGRIQGAGFELCGWDANPESRKASGVPSREPAELAGSCDRIILCLPDSTIVQAVVEQIEGALRPGAIIIDTTTGSPAAVERIAERLALRDVEYLDGCIGGSSEDVRQNRAMILCGGSVTALDQCRATLDAIAPAVFHMGRAGTGTRMKLAFNLVLGLNRAVLAEGLVFAEKAGIDAADALNVLRQGAAYSRVMDTKGWKMIEEEFAPQARLSQHLKDVRHILEEGDALLPLSEVHEKILAEVEAAGYGGEDNSAIVRWFRALGESRSTSSKSSRARPPRPS